MVVHIVKIAAFFFAILSKKHERNRAFICGLLLQHFFTLFQAIASLLVICPLWKEENLD
jgi:hypothetical protein